MSSENVQKGQMKMYNFGGSIFRNIHQRIKQASLLLSTNIMSYALYNYWANKFASQLISAPGFSVFIKKISVLYPVGVPRDFNDFTVMYQPVNDCVCNYCISKNIRPF